MKTAQAKQTPEKLERARVPEMKSIIVKPTWTGLMPAFFAVFENGTEEGKRMVREELMDLARKIDAMNKKGERDDR